MLALGNGAAHRPVVELRLEDDHRVRIANCGGEQAFCIARRRRDRHLHTRRVHVVRLRRVVVELRRPHASSVRHPHRQRELHLPAGAPAIAADVRDQLVERRIAEGVVLHLADGPEAGHAEADRRAHDPGLGERRVHAPVRAELVTQPGGRSEDTPGAADVLAHDHDVLVPGELDVEAVVDRFDEGELTHRGPSSVRRGHSRSSPAGRRGRGRRAATGRRAVRPPRPRFRRASPARPRPGSTRPSRR